MLLNQITKERRKILPPPPKSSLSNGGEYGLGKVTTIVAMMKGSLAKPQAHAAMA